MAALDRLPTLTVGVVLVILVGGCSGGASIPELGAQPTEAMEEIERTKQAAGEGAELPTPTAEPPATTTSSAANRPTWVGQTEPVHFPTANPEGERVEEPTLFEAAEAERLRRKTNPPQSSLVITDENLHEYAEGGQLSEMITEGYEESTAEESAATSTPDDQETYWRTRVRDGRLAWRAAADRVKELQSQVAQLRYDFYAQDDPVYRDLEIRPAWDRAAVDLTQARLRTSDLETQLELILGEGIAAGALPGWLREGIDFEPQSASENSSSDRFADGGSSRPNDYGTAEAIEPPIMEDPPR